jgi:hypothetical protein
VLALDEPHVVVLQPGDRRVGSDQHERLVVRDRRDGAVLELDRHAVAGELAHVGSEPQRDLVCGRHLVEPRLVALLASLETVAAVRQRDRRADVCERHRGFDRRVAAADDEDMLPREFVGIVEPRAHLLEVGSRHGEQARLAAEPGRQHHGPRAIRRHGGLHREDPVVTAHDGIDRLAELDREPPR